MRSEVGPVNGKISRECWDVSAIRLFTGGEQCRRGRGGAPCTDPTANLTRRIARITSQCSDTNAVFNRIDFSALRVSRDAERGKVDAIEYR
ncbi:MAG: hypothetical protein RLY63_176, partial [Chloroflexota bacterium]